MALRVVGVWPSAMFWMLFQFRRTCVWRRGKRGRDNSAMSRELCTPYISGSRHPAGLSRPMSKILIISWKSRATSMLQRTFGTRFSFNGSSKSRMLNIFKLKTLLKFHLKRLFLTCFLDIKVATTLRFVATHTHRVHPGRDCPPVYRDPCRKYKLYHKSRVQPLCLFRRSSFERAISSGLLLKVMGCIFSWNPCLRRTPANAHIGGC